MVLSSEERVMEASMMVSKSAAQSPACVAAFDARFEARCWMSRAQTRPLVKVAIVNQRVG